MPSGKGQPRAPPQPQFQGMNFPLFLQRYQRWLVLARMTDLDDDTHRIWFLAAMDPQVLPIAEGLYARTSSFEQLVQQMSQAFPEFTNDFALRSEIRMLPELPRRPKVEELEQLLVEFEHKLGRMTPDACSDQEKMVLLVSKLPEELWKELRTSTLYRGSLTTYDTTTKRGNVHDNQLA